jgi:Ser/Thr protein kinase RdoA (MazF antagonist)
MTPDPAAALSGRSERADPVVTAAEAQDLSTALFGAQGVARRLTGERDQNFHIRSPDGPEYLLKISHSAEDVAAVDLQTRALLHIATADPGLSTPRVILGLDERPIQTWLPPSGGARLVRLLSFLPGRPMAEQVIDPAQLRALGATLARLNIAMLGLASAAPGPAHIWDLQRAADLGGLAGFIDDPEHRRLTELGLARFIGEAEPQLRTLRSQVIHGDLNPHNAVVDQGPHGPKIGILDFGDAVRAPLVNDVAIAAAYHLQAGSEPFARPTALVEGYHAANPLEERELGLLAPLIAGRMAMTVLIASWRARLHPENRDYILRNAPSALLGLAVLTDPAGRGQAPFQHLMEASPR